MEREDRRTGEDRAVTPGAHGHGPVGRRHPEHHHLPHRRRRERVRWDLVGCALGGHVAHDEQKAAGLLTSPIGRTFQVKIPSPGAANASLSWSASATATL